MAQQKRIYYLTPEQYAILYNDGEKDGSFEKNGVTYTYDENATYYVQTENKNKLELIFNTHKSFSETGEFISEFEETFSDLGLKMGCLYYIKIQTTNAEDTISTSWTSYVWDGDLDIIAWHIFDDEMQVNFGVWQGYNGTVVKFSSPVGWQDVDITIYETQFHL